MGDNSITTQWKTMYRAAAILVFAAVAVMISEIFLTMAPDGAADLGTRTGMDKWFDVFARNGFMAMRNLGLINIIATTMMVPVFFSLWGVHKEEQPVLAGLTLLVFSVGYAIFMAGNSAFPMLALSIKHSSASPEVRQTLSAAGEALIARGASHSPGTFPAFALSEASSILSGILMYRGGVFSKAAGIVGICAFVMMFAFEVLASFMPSLADVAMILAMIGGIGAIVWYVLLATGLWKLSKA